jgi:hypothetical protein
MSDPDWGKIGGFLLSIEAMKPWQVEDVLLAQRAGDRRLFGEIAIALGYVDDAALQRYIEMRPALPTPVPSAIPRAGR